MAKQIVCEKRNKIVITRYGYIKIIISMYNSGHIAKKRARCFCLDCGKDIGLQVKDYCNS